MAFQCEKKFFSNLRDLSLMNGSQLIWKILHFNGLKSSNLKDSVVVTFLLGSLLEWPSLSQFGSTHLKTFLHAVL